MTDEPAFPFDERNGDGSLYRQFPGATLRDYFAAKAMQAFINQIPIDKLWSANETAASAYQVADAMLAARKEQS